MPAPENTAPLVYLILGSAGSGRREILSDLLESGLDDQEKAAVLLAATEPPIPADVRLAARAEITRWSQPATSGTGGAAVPELEADVPPGVTRIFLVADGRANPVDQVEAFKAWVEAKALKLARILCVVNCRLAEAHAPLLHWYDACIHFSDVVLLNHRDGVSNKWISDFQGRLKKEHMPCLVEFVKAGSVHNPPLILEPQALRLSHIFDDEVAWVAVDDEGNPLPDDEDPEAQGDEEVTMVPEEDPYFARSDSGHRIKEIPDILRYL